MIKKFNDVLSNIRKKRPNLYRLILAVWVSLVIYIFIFLGVADSILSLGREIVCSKYLKFACLSEDSAGIFWLIVIVILAVFPVFFRIFHKNK